MDVEFTTPLGEKRGVVASLLKQAYAEIVESEPTLWGSLQKDWEQYDTDVFGQPQTVGACIFLTRLGSHIVGFGSWDPRQGPRYGIVGHNCILPEFRGKGLGKKQIHEILRRFGEMAFETAKVSTNDHSFFVPAQRMYVACGFQEVRRISWDVDPRRKIIEYEREIG